MNACQVVLMPLIEIDENGQGDCEYTYSILGFKGSV